MLSHSKTHLAIYKAGYHLYVFIYTAGYHLYKCFPTLRHHLAIYKAGCHLFLLIATAGHRLYLCILTLRYHLDVYKAIYLHGFIPAGHLDYCTNAPGRFPHSYILAPCLSYEDIIFNVY